MGNELQTYTKAEIAKLDTVKKAAHLAGVAESAAVFYEAQGEHEKAQRALEVAIRAKRQAGLILLPPGRGGRTPRKSGDGGHNRLVPQGTSVTPYQEALEQAGVTPKAAQIWQAAARIPDDKLERYLAEAMLWPDNYSIAAALRYAGAYYGRSDSVEWESPQWLFDMLDGEFHFQVDVCAQPNTAKCKKFYTPEDDGLEQTWSPRTCWMNPPYGPVIKEWMHKAREEAKAGATVVCLVPARTDTNWWWDNALHGEMRFIRGRLTFGGGDVPAPFPSAVVILGPGFGRKVVWWTDAVQPE